MEYLTAFDIKGNKIGKIERDEAHSTNPGKYHKAVWIWFKNSKGEILVQKRSKNMKSSPGKWDFPSAGHVDYDEELLTACVRETQEELGITLPKEKFEFLFTHLKKEGWEFGETYLVKIDMAISEMNIDPHELEEVKWMPFDAFKELFYSSDFVAHAREYKDKVCEILNETPKIEAVVFDLDGTMLDTERMNAECVKSMLEQDGYKTKDFIKWYCSNASGLGIANILKRLQESYGLKITDPDAFVQRFREFRKEYFKTNKPPIKKGLIELLDYLKERGTKIAICSGSWSEQVALKMQSAGVKTDYFDTIIGGDMYKDPKPHYSWVHH